MQNSEFLIFLILILFVTTSWNLLSFRNEYYNHQHQHHHQHNNNQHREGFISFQTTDYNYISCDTGDALSEFNDTFLPYIKKLSENEDMSHSVVELNKITKNDHHNNTTIMLSNLTVFGSYNSLCTGKYLNMRAFALLFDLGVRFFDFEIFNQNIVDDKFVPVVGCGISSSSTNNIFFSDVCSFIKQILKNSKNKKKSTTVFLNLRIQTSYNNLSDAEKKKYFQSIRKNIEDNLGEYYTHENIREPSTYNIVGGDPKIIVIVDRNVCPLPSSDLDNLSNLDSGSSGNQKVYIETTEGGGAGAGAGAGGDSNWNIMNPSEMNDNYFLISSAVATSENPTLDAISKYGFQTALLDFSTTNDEENVLSFLLLFNDKSYLKQSDAIERINVISYIQKNS